MGKCITRPIEIANKCLMAKLHGQSVGVGEMCRTNSFFSLVSVRPRPPTETPYEYNKKGEDGKQKLHTHTQIYIHKIPLNVLCPEDLVASNIVPAKSERGNLEIKLTRV